MLLTSRPDGWHFTQGNLLLEAQKSDRFYATVASRASTQEGGGNASLTSEGWRSGKAELSLGDMYNHATLVAEKDGKLLVDKDWNGERMIGGDVQVRAASPLKDGRQTYEVSCAEQNYTVINDRGRLSVSQDHGPKGPSSGDWSMEMADDGAVTLSAVDSRNRRVEVVEKDSWELAEEAASDIREMLDGGEEKDALAAYREYLTYGDETAGGPQSPEQQEVAQARRARFKEWFDAALFEVAGYQDGKDPVLTQALLQEMGFSKSTSQALTESKEYEIDPPGWFNGHDEEVSNLQVLHEVRGGSEYRHDFGSFREWVNSWEREGSLPEVLEAAQHVYSEQGGQIEQDFGTNLWEMFDVGKPDSVSEFDRKYGYPPL